MDEKHVEGSGATHEPSSAPETTEKPHRVMEDDPVEEELFKNPFIRRRSSTNVFFPDVEEDKEG